MPVKLGSDGYTPDYLVESGLFDSLHFDFRRRRRGGTGGIAEIAFRAGRDSALRDRYTRWHSLDPPAAGGGLSRGLFSKTREAAHKTGGAKRPRLCSVASAGPSRHKVEFPNLDDTYHSIFSFSPAKRFDLGRYRPEERPIPSEVFNVPGLVTLHCDIHEHMRGLILVLNTPYFVVTNPDGRFQLIGLPAGRYVLKAWIDSKTTREQSVEL